MESDPEYARKLVETVTGVFKICYLETVISPK
jgi:hypothetical protein